MPGRVWRSDSETREGYTGHELDPETGLNYAGARYYNSALGVWHVPDPLNEFATPYSYVGGDPISYNDPTGMYSSYSVEGGTRRYSTSSGACCGEGAGARDLEDENQGLLDGSVSAQQAQDQRAARGTGAAVGATAAATGAGGLRVLAWLRGLFWSDPIKTVAVAKVTADVAVGATTGAETPQGAVGRVAGRAAQQTLRASAIRFSQTSVSGVDDIAASMSRNGWVGPPVDVVRLPNGVLMTVDNTRVLAAHRAGIDVQAVVRGFDEALPAGQVGRFTTRRGGVPATWGEAVLNRLGNQNRVFRETYPAGSPVTGSR